MARPRTAGTALFQALGLAALSLLAVPAVDGEPLEWANVERSVVLSDLQGPIDFALAPDGAVWWNEYYSGNTSRHDLDTGTRTVMFHADPIEDGVERGLVGLALDPNVQDNGVFYVYYTVADPADARGGTNRLSRIEGTNETVLLTVSAWALHNGGRILFAPDGSMFVSTGDNQKDGGQHAQDPASLLGKILHLHPDGRQADDNVDGFVYSLGHRNVYGLAFDPATMRLFATENSNAERDEVNLIKPGANYGWPECEGSFRYDAVSKHASDKPCDDPRFSLPIGEFFPNSTAAPTGAAILNGELYWAAWNQGAIHRLVQDPDTCLWNDTVVYRAGGRILDLETGPDGASLYYSNWTHILRLDVPLRGGAAAGAEAAASACTLTTFLAGPEEGPKQEGPAVGAALIAAVAALAAALRRAPRATRTGPGVWP